MSIIFYSGWLTPQLCQKHEDKLFVFGDNVRGFGMGGQAVIRNEQNSFGIPTKRAPSMSSGSFFVSGNSADLDRVLDRLQIMWQRLIEGKVFVVPITTDGEVSLGLERAELKQRAPDIYETIQMHIKEMADVYGCETLETL